MSSNYIFPEFIANKMLNIDQRTQFEASMMSMSLIMIGMVLSVIYSILYFDIQTWFKWVLAVNGFFGIIFLLTYLITTFQAYKSYMEALEFQKELSKMKGGVENAEDTKK